MKTGLFIGRFQPPHIGHVSCIQKILTTRDLVVVLVRRGRRTASNPFTYEERVERFRALLSRMSVLDDRVVFASVPDIDHDLTVFVGRDVGYEVIRLDPDIEAISATAIRAAEDEA